MSEKKDPIAESELAVKLRKLDAELNAITQVHRQLESHCEYEIKIEIADMETFFDTQVIGSQLKDIIVKRRAQLEQFINKAKSDIINVALGKDNDGSDI